MEKRKPKSAANSLLRRVVFPAPEGALTM